jgi:peptidoglycan/LPS O-acetylase OafA/YrhL
MGHECGVTDDSTRNRKIDFLRGISILLVLFHHFNIAYRLNDTFLSRVFGWEAVRAVARNGNYGVTMFFVISGYLITANAFRRWSEPRHVDVGVFYGLRIARIVPCLLLLLAVVNALALAGIAIFQNNSPAGTPVSFWIVNLASLTFWMNVLIGTHGWTNYALGVLWSLSVEEVLPLVSAALPRVSPGGVARCFLARVHHRRSRLPVLPSRRRGRLSLRVFRLLRCDRHWLLRRAAPETFRVV